MAKKTIDETLKHLKKVERWLFAGEIGSALAPFIVLTAVNFNEYFVQQDGWRMSLSFAMLAGATVISICLMAKQKLKLSLASALTGLVIADVICFLLGALITDLAYILLYVIVGFVAALVLNINREKKVSEMDRIKKGINAAKEEIIKEQYKQEHKEEINIGSIL